MKEKNDSPELYKFGEDSIERDDSCAFDRTEHLSTGYVGAKKHKDAQKLLNTMCADICDGKDYTEKMASNEIADDRYIVGEPVYINGKKYIVTEINNSEPIKGYINDDGYVDERFS